MCICDFLFKSNTTKTCSFFKENCAKLNLMVSRVLKVQDWKNMCFYILVVGVSLTRFHASLDTKRILKRSRFGKTCAFIFWLQRWVSPDFMPAWAQKIIWKNIAKTKKEFCAGLFWILLGHFQAFPSLWFCVVPEFSFVKVHDWPYSNLYKKITKQENTNHQFVNTNLNFININKKKNLNYYLFGSKFIYLLYYISLHFSYCLCDWCIISHTFKKSACKQADCTLYKGAKTQVFPNLFLGKKNSWLFQTNCLILVWLFQTTLQQALLRLHSSYKQMKHVEVLFQEFCLFSFISNVFQTNVLHLLAASEAPVWWN